MVNSKYSLFAYGFLVIATLTVNGHSQPSSTNSKSISSIFISERPEKDSTRFNSGDFERKLKRLLRMGGLKTPDSIDDADAAFTFEPSVIITLHGGIDDEDIMVYDCKLKSKTGTEIWKVKQTFVAKNRQSENDKFAANRVAEKLLNAWKRGKLRRR